MSKHTNLVVLDLYEKLEEYIMVNNLKPGDKLPSERYLAELWNVNRLTLRDAIEKLANENKVCKAQGSGTFIAPPKLIENSKKFISHSAGWEADGCTVRSKKISMRIMEANKKLSQHLDVNLGTPIFELKRVRYVSDIPLSIETSHIPESFCPNLDRFDFEHNSLYGTLEKEYGIQLVKQTQVVSLTSITGKEGEYLGVAEDSCAFYITGTALDKEGTPIEYSTAVIRADRYAIKTRLTEEEL